MTTIASLLKEMDQEALTTRKMLQRVPSEKFDWQPHPKSMTLKQLATHVAELPGWVSMVLATDELDFESNPYAARPVSDNNDLLSYFEKQLSDGRSSLEKASEDELNPTWTLRNGKEIYSAQPKGEVIRMAYCQTVHHRAQLGVYLRLLNVPIPGSYGPSADELGF